MATVEHWEYFSELVSAEAHFEPQRSFLKNKWPNWNAPSFAVQALIPRMNALGEEGWELVHMEPIPRMGGNGDVGYPLAGIITVEGYVYGHAYFCGYKRRVQQSDSKESPQ